MKGNIETAAFIFGICLILSHCTNRQTIDLNLNVDKSKVSLAYCAGLKTGEAIKEMLK